MLTKTERRIMMAGAIINFSIAAACLIWLATH